MVHAIQKLAWVGPISKPMIPFLKGLVQTLYTSTLVGLHTVAWYLILTSTQIYKYHSITILKSTGIFIVAERNTFPVCSP